MDHLALKTWLRKYIKLIAVLVVTALTVIAYYAVPSTDEKQMTELEACKTQCAPLAGAMEGQRGLPNASPTERRNHLRFAKCVCR